MVGQSKEQMVVMFTKEKNCAVNPATYIRLGRSSFENKEIFGNLTY